MKARSTHSTDKARMVWAFAITSIALFMTTLDNLVVTTALPVIRHDLHASLAGLEWTVNAYTLTFAVLLLTGRRARRPLRPPPAFRDRPRDLHRRLRPGGARRIGERVDRGTRDPGARRRDRAAADVDDPLGSGAAESPRSRARRLGWDRRPRRRARPARRRRDRARHLLAVDLLVERSVRARADPARAQEAAGDTRLEQAARPARPRPLGRRPARGRLGSRPRQRSRLDVGRSCQPPSSPGPSSSRCSSSGSSARQRRCCPCASSATALSPRRTPPRCSCSSGCSARSSCSPSTSRPCRAPHHSRQACGSCPGQRCRS